MSTQNRVHSNIINYCIIFHMNNCKQTLFYPMLIIMILSHRKWYNLILAPPLGFFKLNPKSISQVEQILTISMAPPLVASFSLTEC